MGWVEDGPTIKKFLKYLNLIQALPKVFRKLETSCLECSHHAPSWVGEVVFGLP